MTSKEALQKIKWNVLTSTLVHKEEHLDLCEQVERDLEVLELLKKHLSIFNTEPQCLIPDLIILQGSEINIDEAKIIKEWLENGKEL